MCEKGRSALCRSLGAAHPTKLRADGELAPKTPGKPCCSETHPVLAGPTAAGGGALRWGSQQPPGGKDTGCQDLGCWPLSVLGLSGFELDRSGVSGIIVFFSMQSQVQERLCPWRASYWLTPALGEASDTPGEGVNGQQGCQGEAWLLSALLTPWLLVVAPQRNSLPSPVHQRWTLYLLFLGAQYEESCKIEEGNRVPHSFGEYLPSLLCALAVLCWLSPRACPSSQSYAPKPMVADYVCEQTD